MKILPITCSCFCLFFTLHAFGQGSVAKHLATARPLQPLNTAAFSSKLSSDLLRQTFTHLVSSPQVAALSKAEQTLLLTHKFVEETQRLPRTSICGKKPSQYTLAQRLETNLGNQFRRMRNDPNTPAAIRGEAIQLQRDFSPHHVAMRVLENLNEWLTKNQSWPRKEIKHEEPLTEEQAYEMALALAVDSLVFNSQTLPQELIEKVEMIREYYDPSYVSVAQQIENYNRSELAPIDRIEPRQPRFYNNSNLPIDPVTNRQQVLPTPSKLVTEPLPLVKIKDITRRLFSWLVYEQRWPQTTRTSKKTFGDLQKDIQEDFLYQDVLLLQRDAPQLIEFLYSSWKDDPFRLQYPFSNIESVEHSLQRIKKSYPSASPEALSSLLDEWRPPQASSAIASRELIQRVQTWKKDHQRWPHEQPWEFPYTYVMYEEIVLAKDLESMVRSWVSHNKRNARIDEVLSSPTRYSHFYLEQLRQLYQQGKN